MSRCLGREEGVSPHHCLAPPHPARWDQGHTGKREITSVRQFWGVGWGWSHPPQHPWVSRKAGKGEGRRPLP